jgi:hypothetical protein
MVPRECGPCGATANVVTCQCTVLWTQPSARSPGLSSSLQTCQSFLLRRISFPLSFLLRRISLLPRTISLLDLRLASRIWRGRTELFSIEAGRCADPARVGTRCGRRLLRCGISIRPLSALVIRDRCGRSHTTLHVRFAPESGQNGPTSWDVRFMPKIYACSLSLRGEDRFRDHAVNPLGAVDHLGDVIIDGYARDHVGLLAS